ncbi:FAD-dependent oxidoreductase [Sphingomonas melonis TY]|uniref:Tryptophan 2-monooxygenase n=1 Tax=Sphingomonas melonis TY TaxID=621456 RepID=A0A175Y1U0_9SPHN|nr:MULTISPECIES: NAD(P)/FAD-dependent oxidoreductase [Sphingomonas]MBI0531841.1 FAD-dependent oxidoreductase [Sphingomonas sp. TX0522]AOW25091.1 FAD-dependent oxidoreductase [Sphingomonas melonis TY]ATI57168.1 FAD-dependent oxidoreductase [Sphingomonas melonis]KZB94734.1 FAD-dependent oxidoreductase [Sphingomonas melonis TY]MBX8844988.1 FAD-dependent oxidoreductase [Sphingomonas melonis]
MSAPAGLTVVVGGGAAGIAAARALHDAGAEVLLVEAGDRLGGRARSLRLPLDGSAAFVPLTPSPRTRSGVHPATGGSFEPRDAPHAAKWTPEQVRGDERIGSKVSVIVDAGCGWLHSAKRNPWTRISEAAGVTIDRSSPNWGVQWRDLGFPPDEQRAFGEAYDRFETAAHAALDGPDRPLSDFVAANDPWRPMIDAISGYANGAPLDRVSLHDWAAYEDAASDDNWALPAGYGTLIVSHARGVPVRLDTPVTRIDHRGTRIRLDTPAGTIDAARVILALPTTAYGGLVFDPPLPDKQQAAANLPLGLADKVFLAVDTPEWPAHAHLTGNPHSACTASHRLSPFGLPIIESFFGGACAEGMADERAATDFAIRELVALLGSDWRRRLHPLGATRWRDAAHIHGSYSHAAVGHAGARAALAAPVDDRLFFVGEACSAHDFSTAHGAYQTGIDAAAAILGLMPEHPAP